jgi:hypothetical protein
MASWGSGLSGIARHLASHGEKFRLAEYLAMAKLTAQHVLSISIVASMGYPRLDLAVPY